MQQKKHYFLVFVVTIVVILLIGFTVRGCVMSQTNPNNSDGNTSITRRSANLQDITIVNEEFDWANIGAKLVINPNVDIDGLELTFKFYNRSNECIKTIVKSLGNVTKGVQINCSISAIEILDILFAIDSEKYTVSGGTVSNFAF